MTKTLVYCWEFYVSSTDQEVTYYTYSSDPQIAYDACFADEGKGACMLDTCDTVPEEEILKVYGKEIILDRTDD